MTAKQFNAALDKLGFTLGLARKLELGERSVRRWAAGQWPVPTPVAMLLNLMLDTDHGREPAVMIITTASAPPGLS